MKELTPKSLRFIPAALGLLICLLANHAGATFTTWDPQGTTGANPYTGDLSGTWENAKWSTSQIGQATPQAWVENTSALFAVHTDTVTPAFTVTMNSDHTVAGIYDGNQTPNACTVTISGTGKIILPASTTQQFFAGGSGCGTITVNNVIAGTSAILQAPGCGSLYLYGVNTYSGGTLLSGAGGVNFNNNSSFGTGTITWGAASTVLANQAASGTVTIANAVATAAGDTQIIVGNTTSTLYHS